MAGRLLKGVAIIPEEKLVFVIDIPADDVLGSLNHFLGCRFVEVVNTSEPLSLYVDEEAGLHPSDINEKFVFADVELIGAAVCLGLPDEEGNDTSLTQSVGQIKNLVIFDEGQDDSESSIEW